MPVHPHAVSRIRLAGAGLAVALFAALATPLPALAQGPESVADLADKLIGAVVNISTSQKVARKRPQVEIPKAPDGSPFQEFFDELFPDRKGEGGQGEDNPRSVQSQGSGFIIDPSGLIVTNNHVIADADEIVANLTDGRKLVAELVGRDPKTDLAVLRVKSDAALPAVAFGNSDKARVGDWVMAIGNPFGFGRTVTLGIVSAIGRDINSGPYDNYIQTDASINKGNSGGPLFNMAGEVVGINTAIISPSGGSIGLGFAIPASLARGVVDQLVKFGETRRGWLGVQIVAVDEEIAESLGLDKPRGALIGDVVRGGPADAAGIKAGDVVLSFDGKDIPEMRMLPKIVADTAVDKDVEVVILRKGQKMALKAKVGRLEDGEKKLASVEDKENPKGEETSPVLGLTLKPLDEQARAENDIAESVKGVLIDSVAEGSQAFEKGIKAGDVIVEIGQEAVASPEAAAARIEKLRKEGRKSALVMVSSKTGDIRFVVLRIEG